MYYSNLGCFYREQGQYRNALTALETALEIEVRMEEVDRLKDPKTNSVMPLNVEAIMTERSSRAETHLNVCAVLSDLGKHE